MQRTERSPLCPVFGPRIGARSRSPALLLSSARVLEVYHTQPIFPDKGDLSTLQNWGHFYFALTGEIYFCFLQPLKI